MAMKTRGLPDMRAPRMPASSAMGSIFSAAASSFSGQRNMSSITPLRPRRKSPTSVEGRLRHGGPAQRESCLAQPLAVTDEGHGDLEGGRARFLQSLQRLLPGRGAEGEEGGRSREVALGLTQRQEIRPARPACRRPAASTCAR